MTVVNGFLGMRLYDGGLRFNPNIPKKWDGCRVKFVYGGAVIGICARHGGTVFTLISGDEVEFEVCGKSVKLTKDNNTYSDAE